MAIKPGYIITDMDFTPLERELKADESPIEYEHATEAKAIAAAKEKLKTGCDEEVWVWRLSHVVSRPDTEPDVDAVPPPRRR